MLFKKKVSTKDLYLVGIHQILDATLIYPDFHLRYEQKPNYCTFAVKKDVDFVDIFTGTMYKSTHHFDIVRGEYVVIEARPFTSQHQYVSKDVLQKELLGFNQALEELKKPPILDRRWR